MLERKRFAEHQKNINAVLKTKITVRDMAIACIAFLIAVIISKK